MTLDGYWWLQAGLSLLLVGSCESGCRGAGLCCSGRETSCTSRGWRSDRTYGICFCDQDCSSTMDCCHDYQTACPGVSCEVSDWTQWSGCSEPCRATIRRRSRTVLQERLNSGRTCPHLEEHAGCAEYWFQHEHCHNSLVPALITTGGYGNARKKRDVPDSSDITGYCIQFQLTSVTQGCRQNGVAHTRWMKHLKEGRQVCVECQPPALPAGHQHCAGDGGESRSEDGSPSLRWQAVGNPQCRGVWRRVGRQEACSCPSAHSFLFI